MAKYRKIAPAIWNDAKFRTLSDNAKLVFFMLLTHPQTSAIGTLRAFPQGLAPEMGWSLKVFREAFGEVLTKGMVVCSEKDGLIWLPNFMKYNAPESPNVLKSWAGSLEECPECNLKNQIYTIVKSFAEGLGEAFRKAFSEAFRLPSLNQEQEQEQKQEQNSNSCAVVSETTTQHQTQAVISLPLNTGDMYPVTQADIEHWRELFPAVDVQQELRRMLGWLEADTRRRKTSNGVKRFITGWLDREQNRGGSRVVTTHRAVPLYGQANN